MNKQERQYWDEVSEGLGITFCQDCVHYGGSEKVFDAKCLASPNASAKVAESRSTYGFCGPSAKYFKDRRETD